MKNIIICFCLLTLSKSMYSQILRFEKLEDFNKQVIPTTQNTVKFFDADNDGDNDLIVAGYPEGGILSTFLYLNDGVGNFSNMENPFTGVHDGSIDVADIDGDGDLDVMITGRSIEEVRDISKLYLNNGAATFTEVQDAPFIGVYASSIAFADIDNDKDQDLLITGNSGEASTKLYKNDGNGSFIEDTRSELVGVYRGAVAFADVDGDGDQDLFITGVTTSGFENDVSILYKNDGKGIFTEEARSPFLSTRFNEIGFADLDNDNDQDLIILKYNNAYSPGTTQLYINDGNGAFTAAPNTPFEDISEGSLDFSDVDNDNDIDIIITGLLSSNLPSGKLYRNYGNLKFSAQNQPSFDGLMSGTVAFSDVNGDSIEDLFFIGIHSDYRASELYLNNTFVLNVDEKMTSNGVNFFPNPSVGEINITLDKISDLILKVSDISGKVVYSDVMIGIENYHFELESSPGVYFIELEMQNEKIGYKLILK